MKYEVCNYIKSWARLRGLGLTIKHSFKDAVRCIGDSTDFKFEDLKSGDIIAESCIIWDEVKDHLDVAISLINEVEKRLKYREFKDMTIADMYPKTMIMTPDEHRVYMNMMKLYTNSVYGAGNHCYGMTGGYTVPRSGKTFYTNEVWKSFLNYHKIPAIDKVIFNDPATIVFWKDGTKTVVKAQDGETYDDEKGLAMAISKKALGNQGNYYNTFDKYLIRPEEEDEPVKMHKTYEMESDMVIYECPVCRKRETRHGENIRPDVEGYCDHKKVELKAPSCDN